MSVAVAVEAAKSPLTTLPIFVRSYFVLFCPLGCRKAFSLCNICIGKCYVNVIVKE